jgi:hypothetical protein
MKKLVVAILSFLYISTSSGATVQMHFCMDKLVDWSIGHNDEKNTCNNCGMEKDGNGKNACCKDEQKQLKIEKDQKAAAAFQLTLSLATALPASYPVYNFAGITSVTEEFPISNAPPRSPQLAVYIRNRTFRI